MKYIYKNEQCIERHLAEGTIEIDPVGFLRGDNFFPGTVVVVDEAQNLTPHEIKTIISSKCSLRCC